jgi:formylglycine-generating enzyme
MTFLFSLSLVAAMSSDIPIQNQQEKPPRDLTNNIGMKFIWIPPGSFTMGSPKDEEGRGEVFPEIKAQFPDGTFEETQHKVTLSKGFYMGVHLVTQEQWKEVMGSSPSHFKGEKNLPVECVTWRDCLEFIEKLKKQDGRPYRLPTEAEWEYSCRAGSTTPFHFGKTISTDQANFDGTHPYGQDKKGVDRKKTTPVDAFPANAFGLFDVHGNLSQWCQDWFGPYPKNDIVDPQGPIDGKFRVTRGGNWASGAGGCRSAGHCGCAPDWQLEFVGLRVCFTLSEQESLQPAPK